MEQAIRKNLRRFLGANENEALCLGHDDMAEKVWQHWTLTFPAVTWRRNVETAISRDCFV